MNEQLIPVSGNQKIAFQCQRCSACCRHVENKVMLEPYDVYQLALHFQSEGLALKPEDICAQYAHPMPLEPYFPIFLLNIEEAVAIERTVIYHLGKESPRQADYIHGILNEHLMRYTASKESEGKTFPDYIGALMADELDHCIQLSKIYRSLKQQENEIRQAQIAEQDRMYQQSVNTEKEKVVGAALQIIRSGGTLKNDTLCYYKDDGSFIETSLILYLMREYHIDVPLRTQGWIKERFSCSARDIERAIFSMQPTRFAYPVDGLIMEYDDLAYGRSLGATGHHENRLIALKWADELYETTFRSIELATTRTGMVSLTARFDPVNMDGATVGRAYLHNLDNFHALQLGSGDTIRVYRANMIIPQIACNLTKSDTYRIPMCCPCCGAALEVGETTGGTHQLFCRNRSCTARLVQKFVHFCDKSRMNIEGLSETTLEKLIGHGWIHTFADLYDLEQHRDAIIQTDGFGEKSFERLQAAIEKSRSCTLAKFIAGLGIPTVGRHAGRELDRCFGGSWQAFEAAIHKGFDFTQLPDFGAVMQENLYTWYADAEEAKLWRPLLEKIHFIKETTPMSITKESPLYGKIVVATGKLEHYTRDGIQNKLLQIGAIPASSVTKKTNYLIVGEKAGSKLTKAQQLGVPTLTEEEFEALLAG